MNKYNQLWSKIKDDLEKSIDTTQVDLWFSNTNLGDIHGETMIIEVPNTFTGDHISKRYSEMIRDSIENITGFRYKIQLRLMEEQPENIHIPDRTNLNQKYTFKNFVIGKSNQFAHAACNSVAQNPGELYNPLFIYGNSGLGKTHLMHAIANRILDENPELNPMYVSSEQFTNEMVDSIRTDSTGDFRERYRNIDVLLIDDIQFLIGKEGTQEEFFHTFNELYQNQKQIVVTSDKPPKDLKGLESRLITRLGGGLIADIENPDLETRIAILRNKNEKGGFDISDDVLDFIAENITTNIRELEGALVRVVAYSSLTQRDVDLEITETVLRDMLDEKPKIQITPDRIKSIVSEKMGVTVDEMNSSRRTAPIAYARQIAMYLCRDMMDISLPNTGQEFGGRDHTTVIYAVNKIKDEIKTDPKVKSLIDDLRSEINTR